MRILSLVPSLTETVLELGLEDGELVGRTAWCIHPASRVADVPVVGGTKRANLKKIAALRPDLVLFDREENSLELHDAVAAEGLDCFVADVDSAAKVPALLEELGMAVGHGQEGRERAEQLRLALEMEPLPGEGPSVVPLIWHDPLMALSPDRYGGDLLRRAGFDVARWPGKGGYPKLTPGEIGEQGVGMLLLTSEPHDFSQAEGEAIADQVAALGYSRPLPLKIDGEALTWFGTRSAASLLSFRRLAETLRS